MDGQRFDAIARVLGGGLPRRGTLRVLAGAALVGVATRTTARTARAGGHFGDHCSKNDPCNDPLVCINLECDHCRKEGDCQNGWCCKGYTCSNHGCVACSSDKARGVASEGCRKRKKKRKNRH